MLGVSREVTTSGLLLVTVFIAQHTAKNLDAAASYIDVGFVVEVTGNVVCTLVADSSVFAMVLNSYHQKPETTTWTKREAPIDDYFPLPRDLR